MGSKILKNTIVAVCDDEPIMLENICSMILNYMKIKNRNCSLQSFLSGTELLKWNAPFDILFLDIQMEHLDGMRAAKLLRDRGFDGPIIFLTILRDKVFDSFEIGAFDYLLKPLDGRHFTRTMDRVFAFLEKKEEKSFIIQKEAELSVVPFSEILYCEILGRKIYLHTKQKTVDYYCRMKTLENEMDSRFFRCHRSYLVNLDYVQSMKNGIITLTDGTKIPLSRLREQNFTKALLSHFKNRRQ